MGLRVGLEFKLLGLGFEAEGCGVEDVRLVVEGLEI